MAHLDPLHPDDIENYEAFAAAAIDRMGFVANATKTMSRRPKIRNAFSRLFGEVMFAGEIETGLKFLMAQMASTSHGCRYCQAHTSHSAHNNGTPEEKIAALYEFETSPLFDNAERAALRLARDAALQPNATTPDHFEDLRTHYTEDQIVELMATVATFGFLNRWNDTMATELEPEPLEFARQHLAPSGWDAGKHE
jgi:uncharacterized peroxidase-related enzyme